jgi:hypothetical protein
MDLQENAMAPIEGEKRKIMRRNHQSQVQNGWTPALNGQIRMEA